jgi:tryptophanyl-tRNA synthetase
LKKLIAKIKTDSLPPEAPKSTEGSILFEIYEAFATPEQLDILRAKYAKGIGWGYVKEDLVQLVDEVMKGPRQKYQELMKDPSYIKQQLHAGAAQARPQAQALLKKIRTAIGIEL